MFFFTGYVVLVCLLSLEWLLCQCHHTQKKTLVCCSFKNNCTLLELSGCADQNEKHFFFWTCLETIIVLEATEKIWIDYLSYEIFRKNSMYRDKYNFLGLLFEDLIRPELQFLKILDEGLLNLFFPVNLLHKMDIKWKLR